MAPKGAKRAAAAAPAGAKRARVAPKDPVLVQCDVVAETIAKAALPEHVVQMLVAMIPRSLGVPVESRHSTQAAVVDMIHSALLDIEKGALQTVEEKKAAVGACADEHSVLNEKAASAEAALEARTRAAKERAEDLMAAAGALSSAQQLLAQKEQAAGLVEEDLAKAVKAKEDLEVALQQFSSLKNGEAVQNTEGALALVVGAGKSCGCDPTMLTSLSSALSKAPDARTSFEEMTLKCFEDALDKRAVGLASEIENLSGPGKAERVAAVSEATAARDEAAARHCACRDASAAADAERAASEVVLKEARDAVRGAQPNLGTAESALHAAEAQVELIRMGGLDTFRVLKERTLVQPEPVPKLVEAAPAEAPIETSPVEA